MEPFDSLKVGDIVTWTHSTPTDNHDYYVRIPFIRVLAVQVVDDRRVGIGANPRTRVFFWKSSGHRCNGDENGPVHNHEFIRIPTQNDINHVNKKRIMQDIMRMLRGLNLDEMSIAELLDVQEFLEYVMHEREQQNDNE